MSATPATVSVVRSVPRATDAVGLAVGPSGSVPRQVGLTRGALEAHGFTGAVGQTLVVPSREGPTVIAVGVGADPGATELRDAAAAFVRAAGKRAALATTLVDASTIDAAAAACAVTEGALLATYRYVGLKNDTSIESPTGERPRGRATERSPRAPRISLGSWRIRPRAT